MAKRLAGSQLNHENWDNDDESEDAGHFKQATDTEIKGRVIKKARRRGVAGGGEEGEKKSAFAGFGGFSATTTAAADTFSFLAKSASTTSAETKKPDLGAFVFGAKTEAAKAAPSLFGSVAGEPAKPTFGGFSFGKKLETDGEKASSAVGSTGKSATETSGDLFAMFKPKTGSWSCNACMVNNEADKVRCAACETPKPGTKPAEPVKSSAIVPSFGESGGFKFGAAATSGTSTLPSTGFSFGSIASSPPSTGGFTFGAASAPKPAAETATTTSGSTGAFVFGQAKTAFGSPVAAFGASAATAKQEAAATTTAPTATGFTFGTTTGAGSASGSAIFSSAAGSKPTAAAAASAAFSFGGSPAAVGKAADKPVLGGFSFGGGTAKTDATVAGSSSPILFGKPPASTTATSVSTPSAESKAAGPAAGTIINTAASLQPATESAPALNPEFLAHLKALNVQITEWIRRHIDDNPLVILSPVFKDYEVHLKEITEKFPPPPTTTTTTSAAAAVTTAAAATAVPAADKAAGLPAVAATKPFSFSGFGGSKTDVGAVSTGFKFGESNKDSGLGGGFTFGSVSSQPPTAPGGFSFGLAAGPPPPASASEQAAGEEEDEDTPPKVEIKQVTEDDALFSKKCKLFYKKEGNYVEKGLGMLYLKSADNGKTQLLMRADTNLGNILLNILLSDQLHNSKVKNNVMLYCVPNPPVDPKADATTPVQMLFRVKTEEDAYELNSKLEEYKAKKSS